MRDRNAAYRWVVLAAAFLVLLTSFSVRLAFANASTPIATQLSLPATAVGAMITAFYAGYVMANLFGGAISDRVGPRKTIIAALISLAICTALFSTATGATQGYVIQFAMGLSAGAYFSATTKLIGAWFPTKERGRAFGIIAMPSSLAVILANSLFPLIIATQSWQNLYQILGGFVAIVAVTCALTLRDAPYATPGAIVLDEASSSVRTLLSDHNFWLLAIGGFGGMWATWGFAFWVNALLITAHGMTPVEAGRIAATFGIGALIAKPVYGLVSDLLQVPRHYLVVVCYVAFAGLLLIFGIVDARWLGLIAPMLGVAAFVYSPIQSAILTEMVGRGHLGTAAGLMNGFWQLGSVLVPIVVGGVFQWTGSFAIAFAVLAAGPILGALSMLLIHSSAVK